MKRFGEEEERDYFFTTETSFNQMVAENEFIEHARVFGNFYGTSKSSVEENLDYGFDVILEIDWQGAKQVQSIEPNAISIFIVPPTHQELEIRLKKKRQRLRSNYFKSTRSSNIRYEKSHEL